MKSPNKKIIGFILLIVVVGFIREHLFKTVNNQVKSVYYNQETFIPDHLAFLKSYSYTQLNILKYILTVIFFLLYFFISRKALQLITGNGLLIKACNVAYAGLFILSALSMLIGYLTGYTGDSYTFSRFCMGLGQSPFVLMTLFAANYIKIPQP